MTKRTLIHPAAFMAISLMLFQAFHANAQTDQKSSANAPTFNFSYRIAGDRAAAPLQAFDDGKKTHLQFRDLNSVPAMFADTPAGKILLKAGSDYDIQPPFVVLRNIEPEIMLIMNKRKAFVSYNGQRSETVVQTPAVYGAKQPVTMNGTVKKPMAAEELLNRTNHHLDATMELPTATKNDVSKKIQVTANDKAHPSTEIHQAISQTSIQPLTEKKPSEEQDELPRRPTRINKGEPIHQALEAIAKSGGWELIWYPSVSWKAIGDVDLTMYKDVVEAVSEVIGILRAEGKPVRLRVSDGNNVMEVLSTEVKND